MKALKLGSLIIMLTTILAGSALAADVLCTTCGEYKSEKQCVDATAAAEDAAKTAAQAALIEKFVSSKKTDYECGKTYETCEKTCPKKRARSEIVNRGTQTQVLQKPVLDPHHKLCLDNCKISRTKCYRMQEEGEKKWRDHITEKMNVESTTCKPAP